MLKSQDISESEIMMDNQLVWVDKSMVTVCVSYEVLGPN